MTTKFLPLLSGALFWTGCVIRTEATGPVQYDSRSFERDNAEEVRVNLNMGAGDLKVGTGTRKLAQTYFTYNVPGWRPEVRYTTSASTGDLTIEQPGSTHHHFGGLKYEWDIRLNEQVPLTLHVHFGAGAAQLDLGTLNLRNVEVDMGVGRIRMDLRGAPTHDYNVQVNGGVGEATIHLPADVGVYAEATGGIGEIKARGLNKQGSHWINSAYASSPVKVHVTVHGGIGSITLIGE